MPNNCCKGCADRADGCHGRCEKYIALRKQLDEQLERRRMIADANAYFTDKKADIADYKRPGSKRTRMRGVHHK